MKVHLVLAGLDAAAGYSHLSRGERPGWELLAVCASAVLVGACGSAVYAGKGGLWPLIGILALPPAMLAGKASAYFASFAVLWILASGGTLPGFAGRGVLRALQMMLGMTGQERFLYELPGAVLLPAALILFAAVLAGLARRASTEGATRAGVACLAVASAGACAWAVAGAGGLAGGAVCGVAALLVVAAAAAAVIRFSPRTVMRLSGALLVLTAVYDFSVIIEGAG